MKKANNKKSTKVKSILPKVLSVIAAVILWFYVADIKTTDDEKVVSGVTVNVMNFDTSGGLDIISGKNYLIDVTIKGEKSKIEKVTSDDIFATIDMNGITDAGVYDLGVDVTSRSGITVKSRTPSEITVRVDKITNKHIPVTVNFKCDNIADDVIDVNSSAPILSASSVQVSGPKTEVDKIDRLVVNITVDYVEETISAKNQTIVPVDKDGNEISSPYINLHQTLVDVTIPVYKSKRVEVAPVFEDELNYWYSYKLHPKEIIIEGESSYIDNITDVKTYPVNINVVSQNLDIPAGVAAYDENNNRIHSVNMTNIVATPITDSEELE